MFLRGIFMRTCDYGCNKEGKYQFKNGKVCCSHSQNKCPGVKNKISKSLTGRIQSEKTKLKRIESRSWYKHSEETKKKIGKSNKGNKRPDLINYNETVKPIIQCGKNNPNWKGGITKVKYCKGWVVLSKELRETDNHKCQNPQCKTADQRSTTHHIDYNKKNCHPNNLITLCNTCNVTANHNREWHKYYYQAVKGL